MAFSESLKKDVRKKAGFQCCRCRKFQVEVHHIIPEKDGGEDTFENAAPLCGYCHNLLRDNPSQRKQIREMRDWWYGVIDRKYGVLPGDPTFLEEIDQRLKTIEKRTEDIPALKEQLKRYTAAFIDKITSETAISGVSAIVTASLPSTGSFSEAFRGRKLFEPGMIPSPSEEEEE